MACLLTTGFTKDCRDAVGGIKNMWVFSKNIGASYVVSGSPAKITQIVGLGDLSVEVFEYQLRREASSFTETINNSYENSTLFYSQELAFSLAKLSSDKRNELALLAKNNVSIIILDNNGAYWLLGKNFGLQLGGTAMSGTAFADKNGYDLTFTGNESEPAQEVHANWFLDLEV